MHLDGELKTITEFLNPDWQIELELMRAVLYREICRTLLSSSNYSLVDALDQCPKVIDVLSRNYNSKIVDLGINACQSLIFDFMKDNDLQPFGFANAEKCFKTARLSSLVFTILSVCFLEAAVIISMSADSIEL